MAGEGSFIISERRERFSDGSPRLRFIFQVAMASRDAALLDALQTFLGCGTIRRRPGGAPGHSEITTFAVTALEQHFEATIPFAEEFLVPCHKREQFERWRDELQRCEPLRPTRYGRGPSPCAVRGCGKPIRGRGLCRSHYYRATGY